MSSNTYHVEPSPSRTVVTTATFTCQDDDNCNYHTDQATTQDTKSYASSVSLNISSLFPSPQSWPELRVNYDAKYPRMDTECKIVEPDCRDGRQWVAKGVLCAYDGRVQEDSSADGVAGEAEEVKKWEIR
jgi:hypothetical protein